MNRPTARGTAVVTKKPPLRLLLVEDNPGDADLVAECLSFNHGHELDLIHATRLKDAIQVISSREVDAVILDLNLPDSAGIESLKRIKAAANGAAIIVLSGAASDQLRDNAINAGAHDFLLKDEHPIRLMARSLLYTVARIKAQQQQHIERMVRAAPDAVLVADANGAVRFMNDAAVELFGRGMEDLMGERLERLA